jgi:hypothetical protein
MSDAAVVTSLIVVDEAGEVTVITGAVLSNVTLVLETVVAALPAASVAAKAKVYTAPSTSDCATLQEFAVLDISKLLWAPVFNAVPTKVHACGDAPSAVPPVLVIVMVPLATASLKEKLTSEEEVMLLMNAELAGRVTVMIGAAVSLVKVSTGLEGPIPPTA